jgi:hypothetical protein
MRYIPVCSATIFAVGLNIDTEEVGVMFHRDGVVTAEYRYPKQEVETRAGLVAWNGPALAGLLAYSANVQQTFAILLRPAKQYVKYPASDLTPAAKAFVRLQKAKGATPEMLQGVVQAEYVDPLHALGVPAMSLPAPA